MSDQAVKLFEALSHVDEELLERCEQKVIRRGTIMRRLSGKYGRAAAACVSLIVAGAAAWGGYRLAVEPGAASGSQAPAELCGMAQSAAPLEDRGAEENVELATGGNGAAEGAAEALPIQEFQSQISGEKQSSSISSGVIREDCSDDIVPGEECQTESEKQEAEEKKPGDSRYAVSWEEACAAEPFASYLPTVLPAGYEALCAGRSLNPDRWNNMIYMWSDGKYVLSLDMTLGEVTTGEDIEKRDGQNEYLAEDFRKELIPVLQPADDPISFTLYYEDGMRIDFKGMVTADQMWEVVESVLK